MRSNIESEIKKIIGRSFKSDADKRRMLEETFSALARYQEKFLSDLESRIDAESTTQDWQKDFEVAVKFVKSGDTESARGLFPQEVTGSFIFDDDAEITMSDAFFVNAPYDELKNICKPKYQGRLVTSDGTVKNFSYCLQRHERFIAAEKILFEVAALYKMNRPVIFSPYARKAVDIKIFGVDADDFKKLRNVELMTEKNNLRGKLVKGNLFWNVQIEEGEMRRGGEVDEYIGADGKLIRYEYFHTFNADEKVFVLPNQHCDDLHINTESGDKTIALCYNSVLKERGYQKVTLTDAHKISDDVFTNDFPRRNDKLRLKTEGDVAKVLACFNETRFGKICPAQFASFNVANFKPLASYAESDRYFYPPEEILLGNVRNKPVCCIKFGGDSIFKTDYANYVLHYLKQNYPEFGWAGVE